jgi:hypothetical protein
LGALQERYLAAMFGAELARAIETLWACAFTWLVAFLDVQWARPSPRQAFLAGTLWLVSALVFEIASVLARGRTVAAIAADGQLSRGRLLPLLWSSVWLVPYLVARLSRSDRKTTNA